MQKIAKLSEKEKRVAEGVGGAALILGGGKLVTSPTTRGDLLGYKRVYHGTSPEKAKSIREKGILAGLSGTGQAGVDKTVPGREIAGDVSKGGVYVSPSKPHARVYALSSGMKGDIGPDELAKAIKDKKLSSKGIRSLLKHINPLSKSQREGVVAIDLPRRQWREMWSDPLMRQVHSESLPEPIRKVLPGGRETAAVGYFDVDPKYIHGGKGFRQQVIDRIKNLPTHMKKSPGRFGFGALTAATGLGAIGGGGYLIHRALTKKEKGRSR